MDGWSDNYLIKPCRECKFASKIKLQTSCTTQKEPFTYSQLSQAMCENEELMPRCKLSMQSG
eukprot:1147562-Pelagomonas_calceolata.AAC.3